MYDFLYFDSDDEKEKRCDYCLYFEKLCEVMFEEYMIFEFFLEDLNVIYFLSVVLCDFLKCG